MDFVFFNEVCNSVNDNARLAASRAGDNEKGAITVLNGFLLLRIQFHFYSTVTLLARFLG